MTLRIEQSLDHGHTIIRLIGRMRVEHVAEVQKQIEASDPAVTLDLDEVRLVDVEVVRFLGVCETRGIELRNGSPYIRDWITRERA